MYEFWTAAVLLIILASLFVIIPVYRFKNKTGKTKNAIQTAQVTSKDERTQQNVLIYRERLKELESDHSKGVITSSDYSQLKDELDRALLEDAEASQLVESGDAIPRNEGSSLLVIAISTLAITLISGSLYFKYGAYEEVSTFLNLKENNTQLTKATELARNGDMSALLEQLHSKLKENPENIEGWSLLAKTAMNTERYSLAVKGFKEIIRLLKAEPEVNYEDLAATYGILAQAHYYKSKGVLNSDVQEATDKALELNPSEPNTFSLLAIHAFTAENFKQAISYWTKILDTYPNHPAADSMKQGIHEAQRRAGIELTKFDSKDSPSISINVSLDSDIKGLTRPDDSIFVFIKDASLGDAPSPPLAASRHTVSELPFTISMTDANSMSPMVKLSDAKRVKVTARISRSGGVKAVSGDIEGESEEIEVDGEQGVNIVINTIIE